MTADETYEVGNVWLRQMYLSAFNWRASVDLLPTLILDGVLVTISCDDTMSYGGVWSQSGCGAAESSFSCSFAN